MSPWPTALLAALLAAAAAHATPLPLPRQAPAAPRAEDPGYRLPDNVIPEHYFVHIRPDYPILPSSGLNQTYGLDAVETYTGDVVIEASISGQEADKIVFHKGATISEISVVCVIDITASAPVSGDGIDIQTSSGGLKYIGTFCDERDGEVLEITEKDEHAETETYTITLKDPIAVGRRIRIVLVFEAKFPEDGLTGFYVSTYNDDDTIAALLTTKFEPTHARKAFPCFDEPALKATFDLAIGVTNLTDALSNMEQSWRTDQNWTIVFKTSPKMSPYLLAFIVYDPETFGYTEEDPRPTDVATFRTWGRKNVIQEDGRLSQIEGPAALAFLESYTNISYNETMSKMDMAAIPDFQSGAMENWALVTYRESALLYGDGSNTAAYKRVLDVIAHELTHMWFGNLVTTEWWSSIWLNEGFAEYIEYLIVHDRYPNWRMLERFVLDEQIAAFTVDADVGAAPLTDETVENPTQIGNHFSTISYSKGAAILRQISNVMGEENFQEGVQDYLDSKKLQAAAPEDLFASLVKYNKQDISKLSDSNFTTVLQEWTTKAGYPFITVSRSGSNTFTITQERFLLIPNPVDAATSYPVYLSWATSKDELSAPKSPGDWMLSTETSKEVTIEDIDSNDWVLFNAYQGGYYRVNYDDAMWNHIERVLDQEENLEKVSPIDRAALVDNALNLARAGNITYARAFRVLRFLRHDVDFAPWAAARSALAHVQRMVGQEPAFKDFIEYIIEKAYNATEFAIGRQDAHLEKVHRTNVLSLACSVGYEPCLEEASRRLQLHLLNPDNPDTRVESDLESVVFCYGLKNDTGDLWEKLWKEYDDSNAARKAIIVTALGCINHRDTLKKYLGKSVDQWTDSNKEVRSQDAYTVFSAVYSSPEGVDVALDFLTFWGYDKLEENYGGVRNALVTLISGLANRLTTQSQLTQLENAIEGYRERHTGALRTVQGNIEWLEEHDVDTISHNLNSAVEFVVVTDGAPSSTLATALTLLCAGLLLLFR